jgi:hypothetical protein
MKYKPEESLMAGATSIPLAVIFAPGMGFWFALRTWPLRAIGVCASTILASRQRKAAAPRTMHLLLV